MQLELLSAVVAVLLAISLATERVVTSVKTLIPQLSVEKKTSAKEEDLAADRARRLTVQFVAFAIAWAMAGLLVRDGGFLMGNIEIQSPTVTVALPAFVVGLLASGGSAFWTNVVSFVSTATDIKKTVKASESLAYEAQARALGRSPEDSGVVAEGGDGPRSAVLPHDQPDADFEIGGFHG